MPVYDIQVKIDPTGAVSGTKQVEKGLNKVEDASDRLRNSIKRTFQFIGVAVAIRELTRTADAYTNLQNRLRVVTSGTQELASVTEELYKISQRTRSSFASSAELYARVALATKEMGVESKQLTEFTESLNQAIILSGASSTEAQAGLLQLSQGMASGVLRGDELRSVLEQLPAVADIIAKSLGVTRGQLRQLGTDGKITAETILTAFKEARVELSERFGTTVPTLGQSFQVLKNSLTVTIGEFDRSIGITRLLSQAIIGLTPHVETIIRLFTALAFTVGTVLAAQAIPKAIAAVKTLTVVIAANPLGFLLITLTTIVSLLIAFSDKIEVGSGSLANLQDVAVATWESILRVVTVFINYFKTNFGGLFEIVTKLFSKVEFSLGGFIKFAAKIMDAYIGLWIGSFKVILAVWSKFPPALKEILILAINGAIGIVENGINGIIGLFNKLFESVGLAANFADVAFAELENSAEGASKGLGEAIGSAMKSGLEFSGVSTFADDILKRAEEIATERKKIADAATKQQQKTSGAVSTPENALFQTILDDLRQEGALLKLNNAERVIQAGLLKVEKKLKRELTETEEAVIDARLRENQSLQVQAELFEQINGPITEYKTTLEGLNVLLEKGRINQEQFNAALGETQVASDLTSLRGELGDPEAQKTAALEEQLFERQSIINQAQEARLISEQEALNLSLAANKAYNDAVLNNALQRQQMELGSTATAFNALANLSAEFAGKESKTSQKLFAISKAFAIAQSTVAIVQGIAKSASLGFPANIGAIAATVAQTAGLVSQIKSVQFAGGFQTGGNFKVGGSGGADSQLVAFRATPNEEVSVRTPSQQKSNNNTQQETPASQGINIINVTDQSLIEDYLNTPEGERVLVNAIGNNRDTISSTLQQS